MLFLTGLLTLLAITHAGGDHIKGGLRIKGGTSPAQQEKIAQEDIPPPPFGIKTAATSYGTKIGAGNVDGRVKGTRVPPRVVQQRADDTLQPSEPRIKTLSSADVQTKTASKTAPVPALHHAVKTEKPGKIQPSPGLHHAASVPVVQDQVVIDDPDSVRDIKVVKTLLRGKTTFTSQDRQVREPTARPVIQTVQTVEDPATGTVKEIKTLKAATAGKTHFSSQDSQVREPTARPVIKTVKTVDDPAAGTIKRIKTLKTATTAGKTHFSPQDTQASKPTAPVIQTVKTMADPQVEDRKGIKTLKTATPSGKTRFSSQDTQVRDPGSAGSPVIQSVKTEDSATPRTSQTVKTLQKTADSPAPRTKTVKSAIKTSQRRINSRDGSSIPESIVETSRRRNLAATYSLAGTPNSESQRSSLTQDRNQAVLLPYTGSQLHSNRGIPGGRGAITLNEEIMEALQNAGGIVNENGEIRLNDEGMKILQKLGISSSIEPSAVPINAPTLTTNQAGSSGIRPLSGTVEETVGLRPAGEMTGLRSGGTAASGTTGLRSSAGVSRTTTRGHGTTGIQGTSIGETLEFKRGTAAFGAVRGAQRTRITGGTSEFITGPEGHRTRGAPEIRRGTTEVGISRTSGTRGTIATSGTRGTGTSGTQGTLGISGTRGTGISGTRRTGTSGTRGTGTSGTRGTGTSGTRGTGTSGTRGAEGTSELRTATAGHGTLGTTIAGGSVGLRTGTVGSVPRIPDIRTTGIRTPDSLTSGTIDFNGKQVNIDGLRAGQIFDENLQPILGGASGRRPGSSATVRSGSITSSTSGISPGSRRTTTQHRQSSTGSLRTPNAVPSPGSPSLNIQSPGVHSPATGSRITTITHSTSGIRSGSPQRQDSRAGLRSSQPTVPASGTASAPGGAPDSLTSGTIDFNGKQVNIDGLRAGQVFDENLQPILGGASGRRPGSSATVRSGSITSSTSGISPGSRRTTTQHRQSSTGSLRTPSAVPSPGSPSLNIQSPGVHSPATGSRITTITHSTSGIRSGSPQRQDSRAGLRSSQPTVPASGTASAPGGAPDSLTSGTIDFNGKQVNIDGLRAGQVFDENLQPILGGASGRRPGSSATVRSGIITSSTSRISPGSRRITTQHRQSSTGSVRTPSAIPSPGYPSLNIQSPAVHSPATGSRITTITHSTSGIRSGSPQRQDSRAGLRSSQPTVPASGTASAPGGATDSLTSGTIDFNGKQVNIDGLRAGQVFDENLQPILGGASGRRPGSSGTVRSGAITSSTSGISPGSRRITTQHRQSSTGSLRTPSAVPSPGYPSLNIQSPAVHSPATGSRITTITHSTSGIRSGLPQRQDSRAGLRSSQPTVPASGTASAPGGAPDSLTSGTIDFNGKQVNIDGLRAGQVFDENLQPILGGASGRRPGSSATVRSGSITSSTSGISPGSRRTTTQHRQSSTGSLRTPSAVPSPGSPSLNIQSPGVHSPATGSRITTITHSTSGIRSGSPQRQDSRAGLRSSQPTVPASGTASAPGGAPDSLTSGTIDFNGKQVNIDGLRAGQVFDENLQPILGGASGRRPGSSATVRSGIITSSTSRISPGSRRITPQHRQSSTGSVRTPSAIPSPGYPSLNIQSPAVHSPATGSRITTITHSTSGIRSGSPQRQDSRAGLRSSQPTVPAIGTASAPGGATDSLTSGTIDFNGKQVNIDGLRAGQVFDENLQPILGGASGRRPGSSATVRSGAITSSTSGISPGSRRITTQHRQSSTGSLRTPSAVPSPGYPSLNIQSPAVHSPATGSRITTITHSTSGIRSGSPQRQDSRAGLRSSQPTVPASGTASAPGGATDSLTSGTIDFNGKQVNIDGLRAGQVFDENLQPILGGASGRRPGSSATVRSGAITSSTSGISPGSRRITTQHRQSSTGSLRTPSAVPSPGSPSLNIQSPGVHSPATGSRITTITHSTSGIRSGSPQRQDSRAGLRSSQPTVPASGTASAPGGATDSLTSGTIDFNGKQVNIDGLRAGQVFDENLQPILGGASGRRPGSSATVRSGAITSSTSGISPGSRRITAQHRQSSTGSLRTPSAFPSPGSPSLNIQSPGVHSPATGSRITTITHSTSGIRSGSPQRQDSHAGLRSSPATLPASGTASALGGAPDSLTSGSIDFNGKQVNIDGLRAGQIFDENLQPILGGASGRRPGSSATVRSGSITSSTSGISPGSRRITTQHRQSSTGSLRTPSAVPSPGSPSLNIQSPGVHSPATGSRITTITHSTSGIRSGSPQRQDSHAGLRSSQPTVPASGTASAPGGAPDSLTSGTIDFNGKQVNIDGLRAGQVFDENLQPILGGASGRRPGSSATVRSGAITSSTSGISPGSRRITTQHRQSSTGSLRTPSAVPSPGSPSLNIQSPGVHSPATGSRITPITHSTAGIRSGSPQRQVSRAGLRSSQPTVPASGTASAPGGAPDSLTSGTIDFNGKQVNIEGLRAGQIFDENLQPILDGISGTRTGNAAIPQTSSMGTSRTDISPRNRVTAFRETTTRGQLGTTASMHRSPGLQPSNQASTIATYASGDAVNPGANARRVSQSKITQEVAQDRIETPVIQQNQDPLSIFQELEPQQEIVQDFVSLKVPSESPSGKVPSVQLSQKTLEPTERKQTQFKVEDVIEQSSESKPYDIRPAQVQEEVPAFTKISQVSQKDIDTPIAQQRVIESYFLPKKSFLAPFNYGIPEIQTLKTGRQTPVTQEQQTLEQIFV